MDKNEARERFEVKIDITPWRRVWSFLDRRERRNAVGLLLLSLFVSASSVGMIFSVVPFLQVFADPNKIKEVPEFNYIYEKLEFTSSYYFIVFVGFFTIFMILFTNVLQAVRTYAFSRYTTMRIHSISMRLLKYYMSSNYDQFIDWNSGEMSNKILSGTFNIRLGGFPCMVESSGIGFGIYDSGIRLRSNFSFYAPLPSPFGANAL